MADPASSNLPLEIGCQETKDLLETGGDVLLVDCREADEYELTRLEQARLLPMSELGQRVGEIEAFRDHRVVVHCHHGGRSLRVAAWLRKQGFPQAQSMAGGIDQWAIDIDPSLIRY